MDSGTLFETAPTWSEVRATKQPEGANDVQTEHVEALWGPIDARSAIEAGAVMPTSSVLLRIRLPDTLRKAVLDQIPTSVLPNDADTAKSLAKRLSCATFLEDSHVLKGGCGPQRVRLNATSYPQPRRRSWSVPAGPMVEDEDGNMIRDMFMYTAYGRLAHDWEAVVMPRPVYDLGVFLWKAAFPLLTLKSQAHPPNGCQLLLYYTAFNSCMGRHRDNYNSKQMAEVLAGRRSVCELVEGNHHGGDANSQLVGSHVLVYTEGDADMNFALAFAPKNNPTAVLDDYIITPQFCTKLGAGTLLVFSPVDDLFFTHEAWFFDTSTGTHRLAFVFRWLTQVRTFYCMDGKLKLSTEMASRAMNRSKRKRKQQAEQRRKLLVRSM